MITTSNSKTQVVMSFGNVSFLNSQLLPTICPILETHVHQCLPFNFFKIYFFFFKNTDHFVSAICMETLIYSPNFSSGLRTTNRPTHLKLVFNVCIGMNQINLIIAFWWSQYMFNRPSWEYIDLWRKQTFHSSLEMKLDVSNIKNLQRYNHNNIKFICLRL